MKDGARSPRSAMEKERLRWKDRKPPQKSAVRSVQLPHQMSSTSPLEIPGPDALANTSGWICTTAPHRCGPGVFWSFSKLSESRNDRKIIMFEGGPPFGQAARVTTRRYWLHTKGWIFPPFRLILLGEKSWQLPAKLFGNVKLPKFLPSPPKLSPYSRILAIRAANIMKCSLQKHFTGPGFAMKVPFGGGSFDINLRGWKWG